MQQAHRVNGSEHILILWTVAVAGKGERRVRVFGLGCQKEFGYSLSFMHEMKSWAKTVHPHKKKRSHVQPLIDC